MCLFVNFYHLPPRKMHSSRKRPQKSPRILTLDVELLHRLLNPPKRLANCRVGLADQIRLLQTSTCTGLTGTKFCLRRLASVLKRTITNADKLRTNSIFCWAVSISLNITNLKYANKLRQSEKE
jgi:hypothetical protein